MPDPLDEDADVRSHLAALGPAALVELRGILEAPRPTAPRSSGRSRLDPLPPTSRR